MNNKELNKKIEICKVQIHNIDLIGKVLVQESNLIDQFNKKNNLVSDKSYFERKAKLDKVQAALNLSVEHFEGRAKAIEEQLAKLQPKKETK